MWDWFVLNLKQGDASLIFFKNDLLLFLNPTVMGANSSLMGTVFSYCFRKWEAVKQVLAAGTSMDTLP